MNLHYTAKGVIIRVMRVTPIATPVIHEGYDLLALIRDSVRELPEKSILAVTSKVVAICEGRLVPIQTGTKEEKQQLAKQEAEAYIDASHSQYQIMITVKHSTVAVNAGVDESNANGHYILLPENPYRSARQIWQFLRKEFGVKEVGVVITDSRTFPLKWGVIGTSLGHCGFKALNNKIGQADLFGHQMQMTQVAVAEALAVAAVLEMGETDEAQPLCLIQDSKMVQFQNRATTQKEINELQIKMKDDVYGPMLLAAPWETKK